MAASIARLTITATFAYLVAGLVPIGPRSVLAPRTALMSDRPMQTGRDVDQVDGDEVGGRVKVKVGPIAVSYAGTARFVETDENANRFVLKASGRETRDVGGASAKVQVTMAEQGSPTQVTLSTTLEITGKQARFGGNVMADVASKLTDQFAACLASTAGAPAGTQYQAAQAQPVQAQPRSICRPRPRTWSAPFS